MSNPKSANSKWLISPKTFISLLGAEYALLKAAGNKTLLRFYFASFSVVFICILSFVSIFYGIDLLFHNVWIEIPLAIFISALFFAIYILLINTFAKDKDGKPHLSFSNITRTAFVAFMAFMISKPVEIYMMKDELNRYVVSYRSKLVSDFQQKLSGIYDSDISKIKLRLVNLSTISGPGYSKSIQQEIDRLNERIATLKNKKGADLTLATQRINNANFFIQQVIYAVSKPLCWLVCIVMLCLFLLPGYLIYSLSAQNEYFKRKKKYEEDVIIAAYNEFCRSYSQIFATNYQQPGLQFYCKYLDPPFKTKKIPPPHYKGEIPFFNKYFPYNP